MLPIFTRKEGRIMIALFGIFLLGVAFGAWIAHCYPLWAQKLFKAFAKGLSELLELTGWRLALGIFLNNLRVTLILSLFGTLLPIMPGIILYINGAAVGIVMGYVIKQERSFTAILGLIPHGVLEIPAILIAATVGTIAGFDLWRLGLGWKAVNLRYQDIFAYIWPRVLLAIGLLLPAAMIEVFITPLFI